MNFFKHLRAIIALPFMVAAVIPAYILYTSKTISLGWSLASPLNFLPVIFGIMFIGFGLVLFYKAVALLATVGQGTLAPWEKK